MTHKEREILEWAKKRHLLSPSRMLNQTLKTVEEVGELCESINKHKSPIDDIGDIYVCIVILANQAGLTMEECVDHAYGEIANRGGKTIDGVFIKSEDLAPET